MLFRSQKYDYGVSDTRLSKTLDIVNDNCLLHNGEQWVIYIPLPEVVKYLSMLFSLVTKFSTCTVFPLYNIYVVMVLSLPHKRI